MDWADDVAYSVHDVEDGIIAGYVRCDRCCSDADERAALCKDVAEVVLGRAGRRARRGAWPSCWPTRRWPRWPTSTAAAGRWSRSSAPRAPHRTVRRGRRDATRDRYGTGRCGATTPTWSCRAPIRAQCALLKGIALRYVMRRPGSEQRYAREQELLRELVAALVVRAPEALDPVFAPAVAGGRRRRGPAPGGHRPGRLADRPGRAGLAPAAGPPEPIGGPGEPVPVQRVRGAGRRSSIGEAQDDDVTSGRS